MNYNDPYFIAATFPADYWDSIPEQDRTVILLEVKNKLSAVGNLEVKEIDPVAVGLRTYESGEGVLVVYEKFIVQADSYHRGGASALLRWYLSKKQSTMYAAVHPWNILCMQQLIKNFNIKPLDYVRLTADHIKGEDAI
jgi:hypothetical protein